MDNKEYRKSQWIGMAVWIGTPHQKSSSDLSFPNLNIIRTVYFGGRSYSPRHSYSPRFTVSYHSAWINCSSLLLISSLANVSQDSFFFFFFITLFLKFSAKIYKKCWTFCNPLSTQNVGMSLWESASNIPICAWAFFPPGYNLYRKDLQEWVWRNCF